MSFMKPTVSVLALSLALVACGNKDAEPAAKTDEATAAHSEAAPAMDAAKEKAADSMDAAAKATDDATDAAGSAMDAAANKADDMKDAAAGAMDSAKEAAGDAMDNAAEAASGAMDKAKEAAAAATDTAAAAITLPAALEGANIKMGAKEFNKCKACHTAGKGQPNRIGPNLYGVFGRKAGSVDKFRYSKPMQNVDWTWNLENLDTWIKDPKADLPGTTMSFVGIKDDAKRKDLLAYLYVETGGEAAE